MDGLSWHALVLSHVSLPLIVLIVLTCVWLLSPVSYSLSSSLCINSSVFPSVLVAVRDGQSEVCETVIMIINMIWRNPQTTKQEKTVRLLKMAM